MKKTLLVLVIAAIGMVSCKKEEVAKPVQVKDAQAIDGDLSRWD